MAVTLSKASDEALIRLIGKESDECAFEVFALRYKRSIYSLALYLTSDKLTAEDVVQETLLAIWGAARTYDSVKGRVRSWVLHIAAHTAIKIRGSRQREEGRVRRRIAKVGSSNPVSLPEYGNTDDREALVALRGLLDRLSKLDRQLVALHYGYELSQHEISKILGVPQRTISSHLAVTLKRLQTRLERAGFAVNAGEAGLLGEAVRTICPAPSGIRIPVLPPRDAATNPRTLVGEARSSPRASCWTGGGPRLALASLAALGLGWCVTLCVASAWVSDQEERVKNAAPVPRPQFEPPPFTPRAVGRPPHRFKRNYAFNFPEELKDFRVVGRVEHLPGRGWDGGGCLKLFDESALLFPDSSSDMPIRITIGMISLPPTSSFFMGSMEMEKGAGWFTIGGSPGQRNSLRAVYRLFAFEDSIQIYLEPGGLQCVTILDSGETLKKFGIYKFRNYLLDDIIIEGISPEEVPDIQKFRDAYQRLRSCGQPGKMIAVPWLSTSDKPVSLILL